MTVCVFVCLCSVIHGLMLQMHLVYSSELGVYVYSAAQVKKAMEVGICVHVKCYFCVRNLCLQCFSTTF